MEGIYLRDGVFVTKECMQNALTEFSNKHDNYFPIVDYNDLFIGEGGFINNEYLKVYLNETSAKIYGAFGLYGKINNF